MSIESFSQWHVETDDNGNRYPYGRRLKARGNLNYLQFIALVKKLWLETHPTIPFLPVDSNFVGVDQKDDSFPRIIYSLDLRRTADNEAKPRFREQVINDLDNEAFIIYGQRFINVIAFTAVDRVAFPRNGAEITEALIEEFEEFMMEITPILKEEGASDVFYHRRFSDAEENRNISDLVKRTVVYQVTLEKQLIKEVSLIKDIHITARSFFDREGFLRFLYPSSYEQITDKTFGHVTLDIEDLMQNQPTVVMLSKSAMRIIN